MSAASPRSGPASGTVTGYLLVWTALMGLLALTVASSFFRLHGWNSTLNLAIAASKAALVAWVFMRLRHATPLVRLFAAAGVMWVAILIGLSLADLLFRPD